MNHFFSIFLLPLLGGLFTPGNCHGTTYHPSGWVDEVRAPRSPAFHTATQNATFDADDRLATFNGQNVSNDTDGHMTHAPVSSTEWKNFQYDARNRLTAVGTTQEWENIFDAEGIRVEYRNAGVPTKFVVSPGTLPKTLVQINDDGTRRYFVHGLGLLYHNDDGETTTYHYNAQGSTIALSDDSGSAIGRFHYDPYGLVQRKEGNTDTIFQFNGHYGIATDPTGLVHLNARFYNPYLKRFMNADPAGFAGGMNWFAYSAGDPVNLMDPLGLGPADSERYTWVDGMQDGIGVGGFFPVLGAIPDGVNGVIYLFRGRIGDSMFSFAAAIPLAGDFVAGVRYADKLNDVRRIADETYEIAEGVRRSKAAAITGQETIMARIMRDGQEDVYQEIPLSSLMSPKEAIDIRSFNDAERFATTLELTRKSPVGKENAISVRLGERGVPMSDVKILYPGSR